MIVRRERKHPPGRSRVPEPMAMDAPESVVQFHDGGLTSSVLAVHDLSARALATLVPKNGRLLDLGVGSGRALHRFLAIRPDVNAIGVDLAPNMLATARQLLDTDGTGRRVSLVEADITDLPGEVVAQKWDAVSCVWTLHHLPDHDVLGAALRQVAAIRARDGSAVWLLDFRRMRSPDTARSLIETLQPDTPPVLKADGIASEAAAFTGDELQGALAAAGLTGLRSGVARPIPWLQVFWCPARTHNGEASSLGRAVPLRGAARVEAALLRRSFTRLPP